MTRATAHIGTDRYATTIQVAGRTLISDEPETNGGKDAGLAPYDLLLSALGSCTAITLRMYADHKGWPLDAVDVSLHFYRDGDRSKIDRTVTLTGNLNEQQRARMAEVTERTPVTLTLKHGSDIATTFV